MFGVLSRSLPKDGFPAKTDEEVFFSREDVKRLGKLRLKADNRNHYMVELVDGREVHVRVKYQPDESDREWLEMQMRKLPVVIVPRDWSWNFAWGPTLVDIPIPSFNEVGAFLAGGQLASMLPVKIVASNVGKMKASAAVSTVATSTDIELLGTVAIEDKRSTVRKAAKARFQEIIVDKVDSDIQRLAPDIVESYNGNMEGVRNGLLVVAADAVSKYLVENWVKLRNPFSVGASGVRGTVHETESETITESYDSTEATAKIEYPSEFSIERPCHLDLLWLQPPWNGLRYSPAVTFFIGDNLHDSVTDKPEGKAQLWGERYVHNNERVEVKTRPVSSFVPSLDTDYVVAIKSTDIKDVVPDAGGGSQLKERTLTIETHGAIAFTYAFTFEARLRDTKWARNK